jgi:hypothetical protein
MPESYPSGKLAAEGAMRTKLFAVSVILAAVAAHAGQEPKKKSADDRTITVRGCVEKSYLYVNAADAVGSYAERYKLRGSKQMLKEIAAKFDKHLLEVTGVVTDLTSGTTHRGKTVQIGKKTTIYTGAKDVPTVPTGSDATLDVQSYRELKDTCR